MVAKIIGKIDTILQNLRTVMINLNILNGFKVTIVPYIFSWIAYDTLKVWTNPYLDSLLAIKKEVLGPDAKLNMLNVGCGNSFIGDDFANAGYGICTNIDFSSVVISHMNKRENINHDIVRYLEMNARRIQLILTC